MTESLFESPEGTREEILAATYASLREHGYADLTIEKIGESFPKSNSLIYHHFAGKDELVVSTLEHLLASFEAEMIDDGIENPRQILEEAVEWICHPDSDLDRYPTFSTLFELRARAIHDEQYREHFARSDRVFKEFFATVISTGIDNGQFEDCDPDTVANLLFVSISGTVQRRSTGDPIDSWLEATKAELEWYLEERVFSP